MMPINEATISSSTNDFQELHMFPVAMNEYLVSPSLEASSSSASHSSNSLLFHLLLLKDKLGQLQNLVDVLVSPQQNLPESTPTAISTINNTINGHARTHTHLQQESPQCEGQQTVIW